MTSTEKRRSAKAKKRIFILDDHPMMRQGLAQLINDEPDLVVAGEAATARQALDLVMARKPDLVLLDISLPDKNGLELIKDLHAVNPEVLMLAVSMHDEALYAERVLRAGARGYIMKQEGGKELLAAVRQVLQGQIYVSAKISARILEIFSGQRQEGAGSPVERLSDREFEVFQLIGEGKGTREIAVHLTLSVKTVEVHRANIKEKLRLKTATDLVRYAVRWAESQRV
jgi:DNA-binding NarL/FixJ family response regulator